MDANDLLLVDMVVGTCGSSLHFSRNRKRGSREAGEVMVGGKRELL